MCVAVVYVATAGSVVSRPQRNQRRLLFFDVNVNNRRERDLTTARQYVDASWFFDKPTNSSGVNDVVSGESPEYQ